VPLSVSCLKSFFKTKPVSFPLPCGQLFASAIFHWRMELLLRGMYVR